MRVEPCFACVLAVAAGCTSTYTVSTLEVRRHQDALRRHGEAEIVDRSGDSLVLSLDDETPWGERVEPLLRGCRDEPAIHWRPGRERHDRGSPGCALDRDDSLTIERTNVFTTLLGSAIALGAVGTLIGCTAACENDTLQMLSGISLFLVPLATLPFWFASGAAAFGTMH